MKIPKIALGSGGIMKNNNDLINMLLAVKENGLNHIDTAHTYNNEIQIGKDISSLSWKDCFITSKVSPINMKYFTRKSVLESIKALGHIDLILLHGPIDKETNVLAYKELMALRKEKLVRLIGVSNFEINQLKEIFDATSEYPANNQIRITPTYVDKELINFCQSKNIQVSAFSPLGSYYRKDSKFYMDKKQKEYIDGLSIKYKRTPSNIIFRWLLDQNINVVFQSRKPERIKDNFNVEGFNLLKSEIDTINSFDKGIRITEMRIPSKEELEKGKFIYE